VQGRYLEHHSSQSARPRQQQLTTSRIDGVEVFSPTTHADDRGSLVEIYRQASFPGVPAFIQANVSRSRARVVRGMHYHVHQADLWAPIQGTIAIGLRDLRPDSTTFGASTMFTTDPLEQPRVVYIPAGVAHGFCAVTDVTLLYLVDREYDGTDEHGFSPTDPALGFTWPVDDPILSERDLEAPSLADALAVHPLADG
jgi:dTDP-4-dehydrorhamnose 3,5-epimerase